MKNIVIFSPIPKQKESSGISIRIEELKSVFRGHGIKTIVHHSLEDYKENINDVIYAMVSTKPESISSKVVDGLKGHDLIVDLYTPIFLEKNVSLSTWNPIDWLTKYKNKKSVKKIISAGKYFFVANKRQKEYWKEITRSLHIPIKENRIYIIPTGAPPLKIPEFKNKKVILWFGGIYPWMNPQPLVKALSQIIKKDRKWKLRFLGGFHPKTGYGDTYKKVVEDAQKYLPKRNLEIIPWQQNADLPKYLNDVAFAVHLPRKSPEDYFAHRVRLLTLLNAGIPIITSGTDLISDLIAEYKTGLKIDMDDLTSVLQAVTSSQYPREIWSKNTLIIQEKLIENQDEFSKFKSILTNNER